MESCALQEKTARVQELEGSLAFLEAQHTSLAEEADSREAQARDPLLYPASAPSLPSNHMRQDAVSVLLVTQDAIHHENASIDSVYML